MAMICQKCGFSNDAGQNYCYSCGEPLTQPQKQTGSASPKPYGWASPSSPLHNFGGAEKSEPAPIQPFAPPIYQPPSPVTARLSTAGYRCPYCGSHATPIIKSRISEGGWITFVIMLLFCFPLFWIGLLMRDSYTVCSSCLR